MDYPVVVVDHLFPEVWSWKDKGYYNPKEGKLARALLRHLADNGETDVGLITPYRAQAAYLRSLWPKEGSVKPDIATIDQFQGREKQVII